MQKKTDELVLGARYLVVPAKGLVVRKAPRVSLAEQGEVVVLTTDWFRCAQHGDVVVFDVHAPQAPEPEPASEPELPTTAELESGPLKTSTRRARGDS